MSLLLQIQTRIIAVRVYARKSARGQIRKGEKMELALGIVCILTGVCFVVFGVKEIIRERKGGK